MRRAVLTALFLAIPLVACDSGSDFCDAVSDYNELATSGLTLDVDSSMSDADVQGRVEQFERDAESLLAEGEQIVNRLEQQAPEDIAQEMATIARWSRTYVTLLRQADLDPFALVGNAELINGLREAAAATERANPVVEEQCDEPLRPLPQPPTPPSPPAAPPIPDVPEVPEAPDAPTFEDPTAPEAPEPPFAPES